MPGKLSLTIPEKQKRCLKISKVIQEEIFDTNRQTEISEVKCRSFNSDQEEAFFIIMKAIQDEDHLQRVFS